AEPERARLCLVEAQTGGPELAARFEATLDRVAAKLREGRRLGSASAELPATHEEATAGALAWLLRERLERGAGGGGLGGVYPETIGIALAPHLGAEPRPARPSPQRPGRPRAPGRRGGGGAGPAGPRGARPPRASPPRRTSATGCPTAWWGRPPSRATPRPRSPGPPPRRRSPAAPSTSTSRARRTASRR